MPNEEPSNASETDLIGQIRGARKQRKSSKSGSSGPASASIPISSNSSGSTLNIHTHSLPSGGTLLSNSVAASSSSLSTSPTSYSTTSSREQAFIHNKLYSDTPQRKKSTKVLPKINTDELRSVKSLTQLAETANGVRMLAKNLSRATIQLDVRAIMIVTKARDNSLIYLTREFVEWIFSRGIGDVTVYVDVNLEKLKRFNAAEIKETYPQSAQNLKYWNRKFALKNPEKFDLVVTLGGDGTVLYVSNLFQRIVPPVMSFALGSLGFLTNFKFQQFRERMRTVIDSGVKAYLRMRFTCRVHKADGKLVCEQQVLNELVVDRGPSPYVTNLELYGDGSLLTVAQADGLIIATPTGSTAYSLSAGGSLVHPSVSAISVTPICPHTLSFRPILLPDGMFLKVKVPATSRSTAWASFDGKVRTELFRGDYVTIQASSYPFPTVISSRTEYFDSVSRNLNWNARESQKPFSLLSDDNQKRYRKKKNNKNKGPILSAALTASLESLNIEQEEEEFDIDGEDDDDEDTLSSSTPSDGDLEILSMDENFNYEEDIPYLPVGDGLSTPPAHGVSFSQFDDRTCWAHPNARISLDGSRSGTNASNTTSASASTAASTTTSTATSTAGTRFPSTSVLYPNE